MRNGGRGTIVGVDPAACAVTVAFRTGETIALPTDYVAAGHVTHAYAMTVHKAQGYVAMSRGRLSNHLYMVGPRPLDPDGAAHAPTAIAAPMSSSPPVSRPARRRALPSTTSPTPRCSSGPSATCSPSSAGCAVSWSMRPRTAATTSSHSHALVTRFTRTSTSSSGRRHDLVEGHRTRRERRRGADPELALVDAKQTDIEQRLARVEDNLGAARTSTRASEAFFEEHAPVARRLDQIDDILNDRIDRAVCRAINDPPAYLTRTIGPPPADREPVGGWIDAATLIETHRLEHGILDGSSALGTEPLDPSAQLLWRQVLREVQEVMSSSGAVREISEVEHDLDLDL